MGTDMSIIVQVRTPAGEWATKGEREVGLPASNDWQSEDPCERAYVLYHLIAGIFPNRWPDIAPLFDHRGLPVDLQPDQREDPTDAGWRHNLDVGGRGVTHATLAELRAVDWAPMSTLCGSDPSEFTFVRWLDGPELTALAAAHGADGVRLLIGFD